MTDTVDDAGDHGRDTFNPVSVADRFTVTVRDDHRANQVLHDALQASNESDDDPVTYNLLADKGPGEDPTGPKPRYHVSATFTNDGMGHPTIDGPLRTLLKRRRVRIVDVGRVSDDVLTIDVRPIEREVEPVEVPVRDVPDDVRGIDHETLRFNAHKVLSHVVDEIGSTRAAYEAASALAVLLHITDPDTTHRSTDADSTAVLKWLSDKAGATWSWVTEDDEEYVEFHDDGTPFTHTHHSVTFGPDGWKSVEVSDIDDVVDARQAARAILSTFADDPTDAVSFPDDFDAATNPRPRRAGYTADAISYPDGFMPYSIRRGRRPGVGLWVQDKDTGDVVAKLPIVDGEWEEVDTGRGIYNVRAAVGHPIEPAAETTVVYRCYECDRRVLVDDFVAADVDGTDMIENRCPHCGHPVDWNRTPDDDAAFDI